jgi:hypothetical protein
MTVRNQLARESQLDWLNCDTLVQEKVTAVAVPVDKNRDEEDEDPMAASRARRKEAARQRLKDRYPNRDDEEEEDVRTTTRGVNKKTAGTAAKMADAKRVSNTHTEDMTPIHMCIQWCTMLVPCISPPAFFAYLGHLSVCLSVCRLVLSRFVLSSKLNAIRICSMVSRRRERKWRTVDDSSNHSHPNSKQNQRQAGCKANINRAPNRFEPCDRPMSISTLCALMCHTVHCSFMHTNVESKDCNSV